MRGFLVISMVAGLLLGGNANAADMANGKTEVVKKSPVDKNQTEANPVVCYPEVLTENEKDMGMQIPCEKKNYIHIPRIKVQENVTHDREGMWTDQEVKDSIISGNKGAWIWSNTTKVNGVEVTLSAVTAGLCNTPAVCPFRVRFRERGKPDVIKGWPDIEQGCASGKYYFIRNDFKEIVACGVHIPLE